MSSEAPGHKTQRTLLLHSCCNHTEGTHAHTHLTEIPYHTQGGKRKISRTMNNSKEYESVASCTCYACYYFTITVSANDNKHADFSTLSSMMVYGIQLEFWQVFQLTIYPYIFRTELVGKNAATISEFLEVEDPTRHWGPRSLELSEILCCLTLFLSSEKLILSVRLHSWPEGLG